MQKLFPPFLNEGSFGDAVLVLQMLLNMLDPEFSVELNGTHSGRSVEAVKRLQQNRLDLEGEDVDGNLGPGTRQALRQKLGIDVEAIPWHKAQTQGYTQWCGPNHEGIKRWPLET